MSDLDHEHSEPSEEGPEDIVARGDPDRYIASLYAPPGRRRALISLYAFNLDVARIRDIVREPLVGHIRLGWWREQIAAIYEKRGVSGPLDGLRDAIARFELPRDLFESYIEARALEQSEVPFADGAALERYARGTAGSIMKLAARIAGAGAAADAAAEPAAVAFAYAGFIRALGFDAARRLCRLPLAWLEAEGLNTEDVFLAKTTPEIRRVVARLAEDARTNLGRARAQRYPRAASAALGPATLAESYLSRALAPGRNLFAREASTQNLLRTARITWSVLSGRL